jgi:2-aminoadipate transaminase
MRLNFSGVTEEEIREGMRRLGEIVCEQVALYGTLTGMAPAAPRRPEARVSPPPAAPASPPAAHEGELAKVVPLPAQRRA